MGRFQPFATGRNRPVDRQASSVSSKLYRDTGRKTATAASKNSRWISRKGLTKGNDMGIFDRLFGGRFTMPPPDETNLSTTAIMKELRPGSQDPKQGQALKALAQALLAFAPENESTRLIRRIMRKYALGEGACTALSDGLLDDARGQKLEYLVLLSVDWKGYDGFEYLAPYLTKAIGLKEPYGYVHNGTSSMSEVLNDFDRWLTRFGKRYLHLDSGGENYDGFIVDSGRVEEIIELAQRAGINVSLDSF